MIGTYNDEKSRPLNVRLVPDRSGRLAEARIEANTEFPVYAVECGWCKVEGGWCDARFVSVREGWCEEPDKAPDKAPGETPEEQAAEGGDLELMTVAELKEHADANGIEYRAKATKQELIEAIAADE